MTNGGSVTSGNLSSKQSWTLFILRRGVFRIPATLHHHDGECEGQEPPAPPDYKVGAGTHCVELILVSLHLLGASLHQPVRRLIFSIIQTSRLSWPALHFIVLGTKILIISPGPAIIPLANNTNFKMNNLGKFWWNLVKILLNTLHPPLSISIFILLIPQRLANIYSVSSNFPRLKSFHGKVVWLSVDTSKASGSVLFRRDRREEGGGEFSQ